MIKINARNDGKQRIFDNVGGIQSSAQADLQNDHVTTATVEILKRNSGNQLKLGRLVLHCIRNRANAGGDFCQGIVINVHSVYTHTLVKRNDIRRGIKACAIARMAEDTLQHSAGRALAVGPCNVDKPQVILRISKCFAQLCYALQARLAKRPVDGVDISE